MSVSFHPLRQSTSVGVETFPARKKQFMKVKTNSMSKAGIHEGDILTIDLEGPPTNGDLLVLDFDGKLVIRQLEIGQHSLQLLPLHGITQPIEWPLHASLPLVGIVKQVVRTM